MCRLNLERFTKIQGIVIIASYSRQLFADIKMKNYKFKPVLLSPGGGQSNGLTKLVLFHDFIMILKENLL